MRRTRSAARGPARPARPWRPARARAAMRVVGTSWHCASEEPLAAGSVQQRVDGAAVIWRKRCVAFAEPAQTLPLIWERLLDPPAVIDGALDARGAPLPGLPPGDQERHIDAPHFGKQRAQRVRDALARCPVRVGR